MKIASTLAWRSLASRPARSFTAALGIGVGIATVLSVRVVDHNTILTQQRKVEGATLGMPDVELRPVESRLPDGGAAPVELATEPGIATFCGLFYNSAEVVSESEKSEATVVGIGPLAASVFGAYDVEEGRDFSGVRAAELLLPERVAGERGWRV